MQSGLPVGVAAFVGRERERAKVTDLVATPTGSSLCRFMGSTLPRSYEHAITCGGLWGSSFIGFEIGSDVGALELTSMSGEVGGMRRGEGGGHQRDEVLLLRSDGRRGADAGRRPRDLHLSLCVSRVGRRRPRREHRQEPLGERSLVGQRLQLRRHFGFPLSKTTVRPRGGCGPPDDRPGSSAKEPVCNPEPS